MKKKNQNFMWRNEPIKVQTKFGTSSLGPNNSPHLQCGFFYYKKQKIQNKIGLNKLHREIDYPNQKSL